MSDQLSYTTKTFWMAHAADLAFDDFEPDPHITPEANRVILHELMFTASTAVAKVWELDNGRVPGIIKSPAPLAPGTIKAARDTWLRQIISNHHRDEARRAAVTDYVTGLGNAAAFAQATRTAKGQAVWFIAIDLDKFKAINDRLDHHAGDAALREFAIILARVSRRYKFRAFRTGGDEFMVFGAGNDRFLFRNKIIADLEKELTERLQGKLPFISADGHRFPAAQFHGMWFTAGAGNTPRGADQKLLQTRRGKRSEAP